MRNFSKLYEQFLDTKIKDDLTILFTKTEIEEEKLLKPVLYQVGMGYYIMVYDWNL
jgi:hypothetical protein